MEKEKVSIIVPMYNAEKFIGKTIESVLSQTYKNWEMLIMNDVSTDNSLAVVNEYAKKDDRIKVVNTEKNMVTEFDEREYEKNPDLKRTYFWRNNYVAIDADENEYIFISKETKEIFMYYFADDIHKIFTEGGNREKWKWIKLGDNFDEFFDKLYYIED